MKRGAERNGVKVSKSRILPFHFLSKRNLCKINVLDEHGSLKHDYKYVLKSIN